MKYPKKRDLMNLDGMYVWVELKDGSVFIGKLEYVDGSKNEFSWQCRKGFFHCQDMLFRVSHVKKVVVMPIGKKND